MARWPAGIIRKTPVTPAGPLRNGAAPGMWTLAEAAFWRKQGLWPLAENYAGWIGLLSGYSSSISGTAYNSSGVDSSGNMYTCGRAYIDGIDQIWVAKYNSSGAIQWQRNIGGPSGFTASAPSIAVSSAGDVHISAYYTNNSSLRAILVVKYNTAGALQWQRRLAGSNVSTYVGGIAVDTSGNVYVSGGDYDNAYSATGAVIAKYNSSGTLQWKKAVFGSGQNYSTAVDTSGNVYLCGPSYNAGNCFIIRKYNTSGALQWQRNLGGGGTGVNGTGYSIAVDISGNAYVCGYSNASGSGDDIQIAKYDTSGTIQWQRYLSGSTDRGYSIAVDGSGNCYVCGQSNASGQYDIQLAKYNTSGTIQWQRRLGGTGEDVGYGIAASSDGTIYVRGYLGTIDAVLVAKLPTDGSLTGTYSVGGNSITYAASSLTASSSSLLSETKSFTDDTSNMTDAASTLTSATSALTSTTTPI